MSVGIFRVALPDGTARLARGTTDGGPARLLDRDLTVARLLAGDASRFREACAGAIDPDGSIPAGTRILAPVDTQEVWAAGVTYRRSRDARKDESTSADVYDRVYVAERPELFFKAPAWRVSGPGAAVGVRADSSWDVPEPELGLVVAEDGTLAGFVIGNDMSSRSIEGDNPLYLPQAKMYDGACALGPCLVPAGAVAAPFGIKLTIERGGETAVTASTSTSEITRPFATLIDHLTRALTIPDGAVLLTGTGIVPPTDFTLAAGDVIHVAIDGLGELVNPVVVVGRDPRRST